MTVETGIRKDEPNQSIILATDETQLFLTKTDGDSMCIRFDKIFGKPKLEVYNTFNLSVKRNFKLMCGYIVNTYREIFLVNNEFNETKSIVMLHILNAQNKIMHEKGMSVKEFIALIGSILHAGNNLLLNSVTKYVNDNYQLNLDETTKRMKEKKKKINTQLIISDDFAKIIISVAYIERLMIPVISQYYTYNKSIFPDKVSQIKGENDSEESQFENSNQEIFEYIMNAVAKDNTENIKNKIYKLVWARIQMTSTSRFWEIAKANGITKETSAAEIFSKILTNSIPKVSLSKSLNVVNYLTAIINNQIMFLFSSKFKTHYQLIDMGANATTSVFESNDDTMTEMEKMDMRVSRKNEGNSVIQDIINDDVIANIEKHMDVAVSKEEIAMTIKYVHMNPVQESIVSLLTYKYFSNTDGIKKINAYDYTKLVVCCAKYLAAHKFIYLPKLLMSICIKQRDRTTITGSKVKLNIENSKRYKELINVKYPEFKDEVEKPIQSIIATVYNSSFVDESGNDIFDLNVKIGNIGEEIVDMCYLI